MTYNVFGGTLNPTLLCTLFTVLLCYVDLYRIASNAGQPGGNYFILLILTDGIITDMHQTCEAIVNVSIMMHSFVITAVTVIVFGSVIEIMVSHPAKQGLIPAETCVTHCSSVEPQTAFGQNFSNAPETFTLTGGHQHVRDLEQLSAQH